MQRTRDQIVESLQTLSKDWAGYTGTERAGAQTFVNQLIEAYTGVADPRSLDASHEAHLPVEESRHGFIDFYWPGVVLIEMKGPKESVRLAEHRPQMLKYWQYAATDDRPAPPFTILCSFNKIEVWEPGRFPNAPRDVFTLEQLPGFVDSLSFLMGTGSNPSYGGPGQRITVDASKNMIDLYNRLLDRLLQHPEYGLSDDDLRRFIVQCTWSLFAEDLSLIPPKRFENLLKSLHADAMGARSRTPGREVQGFLASMNSPLAIDRSEGVLEGLPYVNGGLLENVPYVPLTITDLADLVDASTYDWRYVNPTIFGSLFEGCLGTRRRQFGAHYTFEQDIMQIVEPTILKPWRERIDGAKRYTELEKILTELCRFQVLDPACGSGNFLYVAYREIRRLEHYTKDRINELRTQAGKPFVLHYDYFPIENLHGIEIDPFAVQIARLTLWMGHAQMTREINVEGDDPLPLHNLSTIVEADALKTEWPSVDAIIGNPPFIGSQRIRASNGEDYIRFLNAEFRCGIVDLCAYWFRKAQDCMSDGQRAGFVATNSVSQNKARGASLDYIIGQESVIVEATSTQVWPGEAKVHVSIVNWVKKPSKIPKAVILDKQIVPGINSSLRSGIVVRKPLPLTANDNKAFQGCIPVGKGFILEPEEVRQLVARTEANYHDVVKSFLGSDEIANDPRQAPSRYIIDFGVMSLEEAMAYPAALSIVGERVKPERDTNNRLTTRERWWRYGEARPALRAQLMPLRRYIAVGLHGKRLLFVWAEPRVVPSNAINAIALDDDWSFGVLTSRIHEAWAWEQSSTIKADIRYTPTSAFLTFPFPNPLSPERDEIEQAARDVVAQRGWAAIRLPTITTKQEGLTAIYNAMDEGAFSDLRAAHRHLDEVVCRSYGWPVSVLSSREEMINRLYELNAEIAASPDGYTPFSTTIPATVGPDSTSTA